MKKKKICVIGLGYIGLPIAAVLASKGHLVIGVDNNKKVLSKIKKGKNKIVEADLDRLVKSSISTGKLKVFNKVKKSDIYVICVPTPFKKGRKKISIPKPEIKHVFSAVDSIAPFIKSGDLIILESTSPVGTTEKIKQKFLNNGINIKNVHISYCPERVLPGNIMTELIKNDRIVGGITSTSTKKTVNFYKLFVKGNILKTDAKTAEMCKLAENSFRDLNIAFANELSMICDAKNINIWDLIRLANKHPRVNILDPGAGVGGHCIAVDPWFIVSQDTQNTNLIQTARKVNDYKTKWVIDKIKIVADEYFLKKGIKPKIACLGLAFKPNIDDLRESKPLKVYETLLKKGYKAFAVEPNIKKHKKLPILNLRDAFKKADIFCILVKHKEFQQPNVKNKLNKFIKLDFCGLFR